VPGTFGNILFICTRDSDIVEEDREQHSSHTVLRAELSVLDPNELSIYDAIPPDSDFKAHLEIVVSFLKKIFSVRNIEENQLRSDGNVTINSPIPDTLVFGLHQYVVCSYVKEIITRVGYHLNIKGG